MPLTREQIILGTAATVCAGLLVAVLLVPRHGATGAEETAGGGPVPPEASPPAEAGGTAPPALPGGEPATGSVPAGTPGAADVAPGTTGIAAGAGVGAPESGAAATATAAPAGSATPAGQPSFLSEQNRREVVLFFEKSDSEALGPERRKIFMTSSPADQAKQIVVELINGPHSESLLPTFPQQTNLLGLYLDRSGSAYVDLSPEVATFHPGGTSEELATIFSLVNSLTYNLPEIKRVHILIGGEERDTLKDHLDLRRDYLPDMSIVEMDSGK